MIKTIYSKLRPRRSVLLGGLLAAATAIPGQAVAGPVGLMSFQGEDSKVTTASDDSDDVKKLKAELEKAQAALKASKKALAKYAAAEAKKMAAEEAVEQLKQDTAELLAEKNKAEAKWRKDFAAAKTNAEKGRLFRDRPAPKYGDEFLALYEDNEGVEGSAAALRQALLIGSRPTKTKAAKYLIQVAKDQDPETQKGSYVLLAQFGSGKSREQGLAKLFQLAKKDKDADSLLSQIVGAPGTEGAEVRAKAAAMIWARTKKDLQSAKAPRLLALVGEKGKPDVAIAAYQALLENHPDSPEVARLASNPPRKPSAATEALLKMLMEKGSAEQQIQSALAYIDFARSRDLYKGAYSDATEAQIKTIGRDTFEYLKNDVDPNEMEDVKNRLDTYVKSSADLLQRAKDQLFVINKLSPGATVMEIEGVDLDGESFKLSDYRGKVVFLDFWGDW